MVKMEYFTCKDCTYAIDSIIAESPYALLSRTTEVCRIPGSVRQALFFGPPAQFFCYVPTRIGFEAGFPELSPELRGPPGGPENLRWVLANND